MPWKIEVVDGEHCVIRSDTGETVKCHPTEDDAVDHMRALYANEPEAGKEVFMPTNAEQKLTTDVETKGGVEEKSFEDLQKMYMEQFDAPLSFGELDELREANERRAEIGALYGDLRVLMNNVIQSGDIDDKGAAIEKLAAEFSVRVSQAAKEVVAVKAKWSTSYVNDLPDSAFLWIAPGGEKDDAGKTKPRSLRYFPYKDKEGNVDIPHIRNAIARIPQAKHKSLTDSTKKSLQEKARNILKKAQEKELTFLQKVVYHLKGEIDNDPEPDPVTLPFTVWKDESSGVWHWMAVYSNNYRDNDNPPEILSSKAHEEFVAAVDKGEWDYPEMWLWHVPVSVGKANWLHYDKDTGFAIALGRFYPRFEGVAQRLACLSDKLGVSHGMPNREIRRDKDDPTVIVRYRSREISPLPYYAAANKGTGFHVMTKEKEQEIMQIPESKKAFFEALGLSEEQLAAVLEESKEAMDERGVESKEETTETTVEPADVVETEEVVETDPEPDAEDAEDPVTDDNPMKGITMEDFAKAVSDAILAATTPLQEEIATLKDKLATVETEHKKDRIDMTPGASLREMVMSRVIGSDETRLDGRKSLAKDKPTETDPDQKEGPGTAVSHIPFVAAMLQGKDWREEIEQ